jgi:serine/threonine protein phosphatase PrpC
MIGGSDEDTAVFLQPSPLNVSAGSLSAHVQVELSGLTDPGKVRENNEDHFLIARFDRSMQTLLTNLPSGHVPDQCGETAYGMLVADGLGGAAAGEVASRTAVSVLVDLVLQTPDWILRLDESLLREVRLRMQQRLQQVQQSLIEQARETPMLAGMATTLTLACSLGANLLLVHIGDSRAYLFRHDRLTRLTSDHTVAQSLADRGKIRPEDVATHPWRHALTNALGGTEGRVYVEEHTLPLADGDQVLLCTDGLTDLVQDEAIGEVLRSARTAADACRALVDRALKAGGKDNVTVILGRYRIANDLC